MRKALLLFYVVTFYVFAEMAWWGYLLIKAEPDRKLMVLGEGSVFLFLVCIGIIQIHKTLSRQETFSHQQKNFLLSVTHELKSPLASIKLSLQTILKNIKNGNIENIYDDSYFTGKRTLKDIQSALVKIDTTELGIEQINAGEELSAEYINRRDITAADIKEYRIKGLWYFDKRQAEMKYRLLGIAPVAPDVNTIDQDTPDLVPLFWVFFPDARNVLHEAKAFNNENSSIPFSFDHILNARRFHGYIYKEENVQGDRAITEYVSQNSLMQLLESDRIKDKIRDFELDMWTY